MKDTSSHSGERHFQKEDQNRLADLFGKLDAEILNVPGGYVGFIVQSWYYIDLMGKFLEKQDIADQFRLVESAA